MQKIIAILFAALLLLSLAACSGPGTEPEAQTTGAGQDPSGSGLSPEETGATPEPTGEEDFTFNPETDYDNRYGSSIVCDMVETEDAYYLRNCDFGGFLYYYDKIAEDSGVLCPRPECEHDAIRENPACAGFLGYEYPSLQYYMGQLWYVKSNKGMKFGLYRMNLDGTERELVHEFDPAGTPLEYGNRRLYLHRGVLYHAGFRQEIRDAACFHKLVYGCIPLEDMTIGGKTVKAWEYYVILERDTISMPQPSMYFAGDYAYMFYDYDGLTEQDGKGQEDENWWRERPVTDEIMRWKPSMTEPELLYRSAEEFSILNMYLNSYVASDGTPYFVDTSRVDPYAEKSEDNPYILRLYRVERDGSRTTVIDTSDEPGDHFLLALGDGVIAIADASVFAIRSVNQSIGIRILRFGGEAVETLYEGPLPLLFRSELPMGMKMMNLISSWVTEDTLMIFSSEDFGKKDYDRSWHFVKYDIGAEGLTETVLSEGFSIQHWKQD